MIERNIMDPQTTQYLLIGVVLILIFMSIYTWRVHTERDKYLFKLEPMKRENEKLKEQLTKARLTSDVTDDENTNDNNKKSKKSKKSKAKLDPVTTQNNEEIQSLKSEISKLKERNYSLDQDNKSLRRDIHDHNQSNTDDQKEIVSLRESNSDLNTELQSAKSRIAELEAQLKDASESPVTQPQSESSDDDKKKIAGLEKENSSLNASLKDVRAELASFKRDFKTEVDNAKKEVAQSNNKLKKDLATAQKQLQQSKKRADNNHHIYIIARSQLLLAEKRLQLHEPNYKSAIPLPTSNEAIEETIKKFVTFDARENRASQNLVELNEKLKDLENENQSLKNSLSNEKAISLGALDDDDSLSNLVNDLSTHEISITEAPTVIGIAQTKNETPSISGISAEDLADMDLSKMDDDWESI